jgi:hypothetical protein
MAFKTFFIGKGSSSEKCACPVHDLLGYAPPHGGVLAAQHQPRKSNTYQLLIEVRKPNLIGGIDGDIVGHLSRNIAGDLIAKKLYHYSKTV